MHDFGLRSPVVLALLIPGLRQRRWPSAGVESSYLRDTSAPGRPDVQPEGLRSLLAGAECHARGQSADRRNHLEYFRRAGPPVRRYAWSAGYSDTAAPMNGGSLATTAFGGGTALVNSQTPGNSSS